MSHYSSANIQEVLSAEISDLGTPKNPRSFFTIVSVFIFSVIVSSGVCVFLVGMLDLQMEAELSSGTYLIVAILAPILGFGLGYLTKDSDSSLGTEMVGSSLEYRSDSYGKNLGLGRNNADGEIALGCLFFLFQAAGGFVYTTTRQLYNMLVPNPGRSTLSDLELAASVVAYLLDNVATPVDSLTESLIEQGISRPQLGRVLSLLRKERFLDPSSITNLSIASSKRSLFLT